MDKCQSPRFTKCGLSVSSCQRIKTGADGILGPLIRQAFTRKRSIGWRFAQNAVLLKRIKVIWVVQSSNEKYSVSRPAQISRISLAVPPLRGAFRERHGREAGCGGRGGRF
jgi:hypothetical protein